jgi:hypothetical protein
VHRKGASVFPPAQDLTPDPDSLPVAGPAVVTQVPVMFCVKRLRHQQFYFLAGHLFGGVAEQSLAKPD